MPGQVGVILPVWRESRYLGCVLEQAQLCPGPVYVLWQDKPLWWYGEGEAPSGHNSRVRDVLAEFKGIDVLKMDRAPQSGEQVKGPDGDLAAVYGGYANLIKMGFSLLQNRGVKKVVLFDSDWLMTIDDTLKFFKGCEEHLSDYARVEARHYWRDWQTVYADTGITTAFPIEFPKILEIPEFTRPNHTIPDVMCYHPSYVLTDEEMYEKVHAFGHADYHKQRGFYEKEWLAKDDSIVKPWKTDIELPVDLVVRLKKWGAY